MAKKKKKSYNGQYNKPRMQQAEQARGAQKSYRGKYRGFGQLLHTN